MRAKSFALSAVAPSFDRAQLPNLLMVGASVWLLSVGCGTCAGAGPLTSALPWLGLAYGVVRYLGAGSRANEAMRSIAWFASLAASVAGIWLVYVMMLREHACTACLVFWLAHIGSVLMEKGQSKSRWVLHSLAVLAATSGTVVARFDRAAALEVETWALILLPPGQEPATWIRPGQSIHPDIAIGPGKTAVVVWTNCAPCAKVAATSGGLNAFLADHPGARRWVARSAAADIPASIAEGHLVAPSFFLESLGIAQDDPPAYVVLDGHMVVAVGRLADYRPGLTSALR